MEKRLYRSRTERMVLGVCGGLARHLGVDPTVVRVVAALLIIATGVLPGILVYLVLAVIMPLEPMPEDKTKV